MLMTRQRIRLRCCSRCYCRSDCAGIRIHLPVPVRDCAHVRTFDFASSPVLLVLGSCLVLGLNCVLSVCPGFLLRTHPAAAAAAAAVAAFAAFALVIVIEIEIGHWRKLALGY
jgi:hypothetical protein